jgi:hypothetical protein
MTVIGLITAYTLIGFLILLVLHRRGWRSESEDGILIVALWPLIPPMMVIGHVIITIIKLNERDNE